MKIYCTQIDFYNYNYNIIVQIQKNLLFAQPVYQF